MSRKKQPSRFMGVAKQIGSAFLFALIAAYIGFHLYSVGQFFMHL